MHKLNIYDRCQVTRKNEVNSYVKSYLSRHYGYYYTTYWWLYKTT